MTEDEVRAAVEVANIQTLLMLVFQATGDKSWLEKPYQPTRGKGLGDHDSGGLPGEVQAIIRHAAVRAILDLQAGRPAAVPAPPPELMARMMSVCMGEPIGLDRGEMLSAELARRMSGQAIEQAASVKFPDWRVIVIGAGVAGITAARELENLGLDYVIFDQQPVPGGSWWQNVYPGAGVDTPSHLYSFSFAPYDWHRHFELRDSLQHYFEAVVSSMRVEDRIRFGVEVVSAMYREDDAAWDVRVRDRTGASETLRCDILISAVGVLNKPRIPEAKGLGTFRGPSFHSTEWPTGLDLDGKRVSVIGTGASSMQICPAIAGEAGHLTIFQRSPQWVAPFEKFQQPIPDELRSLLRSCPLYRSWYWIRLFWQFGDKVIEALRVDPEWPHPERAVNARNDGHRKLFTNYIRDQLQGHESLLPKVLPDYPPFGKRILLDNGWYATLKRDNVDLVAEAVTKVCPDRVVTETGLEVKSDILVWATGFEAARFISSVDVIGVGGHRLRDVWEDDNPRAYLGVSVPGFPNFFMLGGPNSFPGSGSFMFFMEIQMRYISALLTELARGGLGPIDASVEATDMYNCLVDEVHDRTVWTHPGMSTYYRNSRGRVVFVMPFLNVEYWHMTKRPDLENYTVRQ
jgi:4-hydroxyacetophenone monooxygenase